jgi:hypothetical protein
VFNAVQVSEVTGFTANGGAVTAQGFGSVSIGPAVGLALGGAGGGVLYAPQVGDLLVTAKGAGGEDVLLAGSIDPQAPPAWIAALNLAPGEVAVGNAAGAHIRLTALGDVVLVPAPGRSVLLGTAGAAVATVGSAVSASGSDPQGGTVNVTGTITSGSGEVKA